MAGEWLRRFHPQDPAQRLGSEAPRLICFPHAGGAASAFLPLARALAPAVEVLAAQYPGRQDRRSEQPVDDMGRLADALTEQVRSRVTGPYVLFGHSMGAVAAYEVARRLAERSLPGPEALILSGRGAPTARPARYDSLRTDEDILRVVRLLGAPLRGCSRTRSCGRWSCLRFGPTTGRSADTSGDPARASACRSPC